MNGNIIRYMAAGVAVLLLVVGVWLVFFHTSSSTPSADTTSGFGVGDNRVVTVPASGAPDTSNNVITEGNQTSQKIFKVADGPVTTATLIQTTLPTTTLARYVLQENGHTFDLPLDNAGAVPRAVSNTTIPGTMRGIWGESGNSVILQYLDSGIVKSVYLGFPTASTTATSSALRPVQIHFLPDALTDLGTSPDGKNVVYLLRTSAGADGYIAKQDGSGPKKLFSVPLGGLLVSWPAQNTILLETKSAVGVPGAAFSVNAQSGAVVALLYASGLTATADKTFNTVVYQTSDGSGATSYAHNIKTGKDSSLAFNPIPEKCTWSGGASDTLYCAAPLDAVPSNYLDLWHQGAASIADAILLYNFSTGGSSIVATPGTVDGGEDSDVSELAVSPDEHYLLFIKKSDRSLWAVRL